MNKKELFKKDFARIRRKIEKYNKELADYVKMTGDNEVPDIDSTIIGTSPMNPIEVKELPNGVSYTDDGWWENITVESVYGEYWLSGEDELDDLLKYNRRRLRKGVRVWKSENPDIELEKDDD
ncbi:hypothetical protein SAMN04487851_11475 [Prevotella sp. tc2-28]|uniref:hypothetical protein n=1 Tax=Prevotella sp. tc2-28 TaxID=1761888 RepID=UPI0008972FD2|nr:hypothetical protein [Prevotella sp. tc2-28]SEA80032.1 hypothetical protein SAMN04487851_11475 [Prevotella sp. tc2-28]